MKLYSFIRLSKCHLRQKEKQLQYNVRWLLHCRRKRAGASLFSRAFCCSCVDTACRIFSSLPHTPSPTLCEVSKRRILCILGLFYYVLIVTLLLPSAQPTIPQGPVVSFHHIPKSWDHLLLLFSSSLPVGSQDARHMGFSYVHAFKRRFLELSCFLSQTVSASPVTTTRESLCTC